VKTKDFKPKNDMSKYMHTQKLLESGFLLANENISVNIDTVKPRILGIYAYNKFGRLHQLVYDTDFMEQFKGQWGIIPQYHENGQLCLPFLHDNYLRGKDTYNSYKPSKVVFDAENNLLKLEGIRMYDENNKEHDSIDFYVQLVNDTILLKVKFPQDVDKKRIHLPWYPLYDKYITGDGEEHFIEYYNYGFEGEYFPYFKKDIGKALTLKDHHSGQAGLRIEARNGSIELVSATEPALGHILKLSTDVECADDMMEIDIHLLKNPITVSCNPYYSVNDDIKLDIEFEKEAAPDNFDCDYPISDGQICVGKGCEKGEHNVTLRYKDYILKNKFYVVENPENKILKMADACRSFLWKEGKMKGIVPQGFDLETLEARPLSNFYYISHGMRIVPVLNAAALLKEDISYTEEAYNIIKRVIEISHKGEDGSIFTPICFDGDGKAASTNGSRPSDQGIIIKGLLYCAESFQYFGKGDSAVECLKKAYGYFETLKKMQCEDGSFWSAYHYPSAEPNLSCGEYKGTVNTWCMQLWNLAQLMRKLEIGKEDKYIQVNEIMSFIERFVDSQIKKSPSIMEICGGGEDPANFGDALNTVATYFAMKYMLSGDERYKEYARQALYKAWLTSCFYVDMPEYFSLYGFSELGQFYNQPNGLMSFGGMHCLTIIESNMFCYTNLGIEMGLDVARYVYTDRLATFVKDNGGIYAAVFKSPNYFHREERYSEALMYGGVGVFSYYLLKNSHN
jgi:hypothetical protein